MIENYPLYLHFQVCDYPLAVMDASSFSVDDQIAHHIHMNVVIADNHNLNGFPKYDPHHKWYYLSRQTPQDILIFHQYSNMKASEFKNTFT